MADPFNPFGSAVFGQLSRDPRAGQLGAPGFAQAPQVAPGPQASPGVLPTFARPLSTMQPPAGLNPQASRLAQAFQPPAKPTFTDPSRSMAPPGVGDFGGSQGPQSPLLKPSGPITPKSSVNVVGTGQVTPQGSSDSQPSPQSGDNSNANNPWMNPAQLAGMDGSGGKKPGDGLLAFMNSGAPKAFQNPQQGALPDGRTIDGAAETVDNPDPTKSLFGGGIGEKGSVASMLTGGSELDPKSALSGIMKLFGGLGGFGL